MANLSTTKDILDAMQAAMIAAWGDASGVANIIADANHFIRKLPWEDPSEDDLPGVYLVPVPELIKDATNASDDYGFGVQVTIAQDSNRNLTANADRLFWWRETGMGLFYNKRLSGIDGSYKCVVEPKPVIDPANFRDMVDATAFVVRVWVRKQRP